MDGKISERVDQGVSRAICEGVGERLQDMLRVDNLLPSARIEHLMDLLRKLDG
jgi:hypothetical protein